MMTRARHPLAVVDTYSPSAAAPAKRQTPPSSPSTAYSEELPPDDADDDQEMDDTDAEEVQDDEDDHLDVDEHDTAGSDDSLVVLEPGEEDESSSEEEEEEEADEDEELMHVDPEDWDSVWSEIHDLEDSVPCLQGEYKLVDRLGEGTFSSVYKAIDLRHSSYDCRLWTTPYSIMPRDEYGNHISSEAPRTTQLTQLEAQKNKGKVYVALKRIYVTSSATRIQNELDILNDLRGCTNVAYLIEALRWEDQVIAVMPFNRHQDFRDYYRKATFPLLRSYFASLFRALACTHEQQIVHRDVKPANFLYDVITGTGVLCDFGLAEKLGQGNTWDTWRSECCHSYPGPSTGGAIGRARQTLLLQDLAPGVAPGLLAGLHGAKMPKPVSLAEQLLTMKEERQAWRRATADTATRVEVERSRFPYPSLRMMGELHARADEMRSFYKNWKAPVPGKVPSHHEGGRVGTLLSDKRPKTYANRAGTRGFRAPEVLLKCPDQTVSLDIWSAGIILLCFLTQRFPFFNSNDDTEALAELTAIFGRKKMAACAAMHNRTITTNIPDYTIPIHPTLHSLVTELNPSLLVPHLYPSAELNSVIDFLERCLELDGTQRWTAEELLEHEFLSEEGAQYDLGGGRLGQRGVMHLAVADWAGGIRTGPLLDAIL